MPSSDRAMSQLSFQIKRGLAEFGYSDHYAVLGLGIDASTGEIRKRYLQLARILHPDSCAVTADRELASQILSKLVNPAYQFLSQDKERTDYIMLLKLVGQRAHLEYDSAKLFYPCAKELLSADQYEAFYQETVQALSQTQYRQLPEVINAIEQLSELNLAFLLRREVSQVTSSSPFAYAAPPPTVETQPSSPEVSVTTNARKPTEQRATSSDDFVKQYVRRAEDLIAKNLYQPAIQELRDALRLSPQNSRCHGLMGAVYLKQNQPKMAKGHLTQALKFDPNNAEALEGMKELKKQEAQVAKAPQPIGKATQPGVKPEERRGLFGLRFGGKK
jgi:curved DNA-binding protein CbpA